MSPGGIVGIIFSAGTMIAIIVTIILVSAYYLRDKYNEKWRNKWLIALQDIEAWKKRYQEAKAEEKSDHYLIELLKEWEERWGEKTLYGYGAGGRLADIEEMMDLLHKTQKVLKTT